MSTSRSPSIGIARAPLWKTAGPGVLVILALGCDGRGSTPAVCRVIFNKNCDRCASSSDVTSAE